VYVLAYISFSFCPAWSTPWPPPSLPLSSFSHPLCHLLNHPKNPHTHTPPFAFICVSLSIARNVHMLQSALHIHFQLSHTCEQKHRHTQSQKHTHTHTYIYREGQDNKVEWVVMGVVQRATCCLELHTCCHCYFSSFNLPPFKVHHPSNHPTPPHSPSRHPHFFGVVALATIISMRYSFASFFT